MLAVAVNPDATKILLSFKWEDHPIESPSRKGLPMNSDLNQFVTKYLLIVAATLMSVSFVAFVSIPYSLGGHPGEEQALQTPVTVTSDQAKA
jgi:hypothetical protein